MALEKVKVGSVDYEIPKPITKERSEFDGMYIKKIIQFKYNGGPTNSIGDIGGGDMGGPSNIVPYYITI